MSRRESRASTGARQNDALYEFETFKKKFLLANKHITKLNSTLSVRIEDLNAQIHALNVENLRLRTSELQLASELKREREKSRKIMADAELATLNLTKHLNYLRTSLEIPRTPPPPRIPPSPKARHRPPPPDPTTETDTPRIARPPTVPGINEEEEPPEVESTSAKRKSSVRRRLSASNLPVATSRIPTPDVVHMDLSVAVGSSGLGKRKPTRRQSGLLTVNTQATPRPASPAFGSPVRLEAGRAELREEMAALNGEIEVPEDEEEEKAVSKRRPKSRMEVAEIGVLEDEDEERKVSKRRPKSDDVLEDEDEEKKVMKRRAKSRLEMGEIVLEDEEEERKALKRRAKNRLESTPMPASKERKRRREDDDTHLVTVEAITAKLKNVTTGRTALQPIDNTIHDQFDDLVSQGKQFLESLSPSPVISAGSAHSEPEGSQDAAGRESRRARKSVNYAEPKLNTKMRRPEGVPGLGVEHRKKRTSAAAVMGTARSREGSENPESQALEPAEGDDDAAGVTTVRRRKSRPQVYEDDEDSDGGEGDEEYAPPGSKKTWGNINIDGRRRLPGRRAGEGEGRRHSMAV